MLRLILSLVLSLLTTASFAGVKVIFLNGIDGYPTKNEASTQKIRTILINNGYISKFEAAGARFIAWNNPGDGAFDDKLELYLQAVDSSIALTNARFSNPGSQAANSPEYKSALGNLYFQKINSGGAVSEDARHVYSVVQSLATYVANETLLLGNKVIVVSHSQGNFFAEAMDAYVRHARTSSQISVLDRNLRFVGAASVAASTPNNRYISVSEDKALDAHAIATSTIINFSLLPRNADLCNILNAGCLGGLLGVDLSIHGFQEIYTSSLADRSSGRSLSGILAAYISASFDEINTTITQGPITVAQGSTVTVSFLLIQPFVTTPTNIRGGLNLVGNFDGIVTASIYNGNALLGTTTWGNTNVFGWSFMAPGSGWPLSLQVDFTNILNRSIVGRFDITANAPFTFDPNGASTLVDLTNCRGDTLAACSIAGQGAITSIAVNGTVVR